MWIHFLLWVAVTVSAEEPLYRKIGDKAVLTPDSHQENPIYKIVWKHGSELAMEWYRDGDKTFSYQQFKGRGSLNILTGVMMITGLTRDDSGIYTVEINGKVYNQTQLLVISPVPKPTLPVSCDPEKTYCVFTCDGSTTGAEPVTFWWTAGGKRWNSTNQLNITKEEEEESVSCELENPVSSSSSKKVFKPFLKKLLHRKTGDKAVLTPDSVENPIYSIKWKHEHYTAMEWYQNGNGSLSYLQFKDRGSLDISTGEMTITGLTLDDSGIYIAEINGKPNSKTELLVTLSDRTWIYISAGVGGGIVVVCIIIVIYLIHKYSKDFKPQWQYKRRSAGWRNFSKKTDPLNGCSVTNNEVETWYQEKPHDKMLFTVNENEFELDFKAMIQTNLKTKTKRKVRRVMLPPD